MNIQPLGEQIIIRTLPPSSVGSIIIPDSVKGITITGSQKGDAPDVINFVEAEVIATGPGKRVKDPKLLDDLMAKLLDTGSPQWSLKPFEARYNNRNERVPIGVKPGDRILYHPAVQKFDREITHLMNGTDSNGSKYFIIREDSVLAVIET